MIGYASPHAEPMVNGNESLKYLEWLRRQGEVTIQSTPGTWIAVFEGSDGRTTKGIAPDLPAAVLCLYTEVWGRG